MKKTHKVYIPIEVGPITFPTVCGAPSGKEESILWREVTCEECLKDKVSND